MAWDLEYEKAFRGAAMEWLAESTTPERDWLRSKMLQEFEFDGIRIPLIDAQRGIRKPAAARAALSVRTVYRPEGIERPYEDAIGADELLRYKWRGHDPKHPENRALRAAMRDALPLIWFFGIGPGEYKPIYPVYIVGEEPENHQFVIAVDEVQRQSLAEGAEEHVKRYLRVETNHRVHQKLFRATVMRAYETRCAVCALRHGDLLDAAHIVDDSDERGVAAIRNGMALCKIHHVAFDANILGIRPDLVVQIRRDLLLEVDGPMLRYGLKERHGERLMVLPARRKEHPDRELLEVAYEQFRSAS
ncbi:HNH endonuclease [Janibacter sp. LM]|uniref:HNH endonuclease n=1 Tax=Janibacter sp. LM TaxID=3144845 RepID=UPI0031F67B67